MTRSPSALVTYSYATSEWQNAYKGITLDSHESRYFDCYCYWNGNYTNSLRAFFSGLLLADIEDDLKNPLTEIMTRINDNRRLVEYREDSEIEEISHDVLRSIDYKCGEVSLEKICELQLETHKLNVIFEATNASNNKGGILGEITFDPLEIRIYRSLDQTQEREKFTLAHELGHYLLPHSRYMAREYVEEVDFNVEKPRELGVKDIMRMEWQANHFASSLLLPQSQFIADFFSIVESLELTDRGFGILYLDEQPCNLHNFYHVINTLKTKYKVSMQVIKIRLKKMGLLKEMGDNQASYLSSKIIDNLAP